MLTLRQSKNKDGTTNEYWYGGCVGINCDGATVLGRGFSNRYTVHTDGGISWERMPEVGAYRLSDHCAWILDDPLAAGLPMMPIDNPCN